MHCTWDAQFPPPIMTLGGMNLSVVEEFRLLGSIIQSSGHSTAAIHDRLAKARGSFSGLWHLWKDRALPLRLKSLIWRIAVLPVLMYGAESWTVLRPDLDSMEHFLNFSCRVMCSHVWRLTLGLCYQ
jgi:hypothetical protein